MDKLINQRNNVFLNKEVNTNDIILIDFYNMYCNFVDFQKYNTFTEESVIKCLNIIINKFKECEFCYIISKGIHETNGIGCIRDIIKNYSNFEYLIVEDKLKISGLNRERDDFYLLYLYNNLLNNGNNVVIVSNDQFRNYSTLIKKVKPIEITKITNTYVEYAKQCDINYIKTTIYINSHLELNRVGFNF